MRKQINSLIQLWAEDYNVAFSSEAGDALAKLVEKEFTSTNSDLMQLLRRAQSYIISSQLGFTKSEQQLIDDINAVLYRSGLGHCASTNVSYTITLEEAFDAGVRGGKGLDTDDFDEWYLKYIKAIKLP